MNNLPCHILTFYVYFDRFLVSRVDKECGEVGFEHCADGKFYVYVMVCICIYI